MTEVGSEVTAERSATPPERGATFHRAAPQAPRQSWDLARERASLGRGRAGRWPRLQIREAFFHNGGCCLWDNTDLITEPNRLWLLTHKDNIQTNTSQT